MNTQGAECPSGSRRDRQRCRGALRRNAVLPCVYFLLRDKRFEILADLLERDGWSELQIRDHQSKRLASLLRVSWDHNPYWREKFETHGVNPHGSDPFNELSKLPILTKDELRQNWRRMRSDHLPLRSLIHETSSGSTGMPINVYHSRYYHDLDAAMHYRMCSWMGIQVGEPYLAVGASGPFMTWKKSFLRSCRNLLDAGQIIDGNILDRTRIARQLRKAESRRPAHVFGYATALVEVARVGQQLGITWDSVRAVSTTSECLFDKDRQYLSQTFGAPVFDRYGSREVSSISMECPRGHHHQFADLNILEFLPLEDADEGLHAVVVTPLENEAMPMFRYQNGDSARAVHAKCSCGRRLPLMSACCGRICNNLLAPDGRLVHGTYFLNFFYYQEGFRAWQFHQTSLEKIDLYVVPDGLLSDERREYLHKCIDKIAHDYRGQFHVELHIVDSIPKTSSGKHLYTISDVLKNL